MSKNSFEKPVAPVLVAENAVDDDIAKKLEKQLKELVADLEIEGREKYAKVFTNKSTGEFKEDQFNEFLGVWIMEKLAAEDELREIRAVLENVSVERNAMSRDSVSGLYRREFLFKKMDKKLRELYSLGDADKPAAVLDKILNKELSKEESSMLAVMSDMSFLSLANERTHEEGDDLIAKVGRAWLEEGRQAYRHGGDEMTDLVDAKDVKDYQRKIVGLKERIKNIKVSIFEHYGLRPNIDIGQASLGEALGIYKNLGSESKYAEIIKRNPLKELEGLWVQIADKRANIEKGIERILFLVERYKSTESHEGYYTIINSARKGAYNISDQEIKILSEIENDVELMEKVRESVVGFEEKQIASQREDVDVGDHISMYKFSKAKEVYRLAIKDYKKPDVQSLLTQA